MKWIDVVRIRGPVWYSDPLTFCNEVFLEKPREWQPEALDLVGRGPRISCVACRNAGKTRLAAYVALWFLCTRPNSLVITIAPSWKQVEQNIWPDIHHLWKNSYLPNLYPDWTLLKTEIQTSEPKWRAIGLSSDRPENIEGRHGEAVLVVIDEAQSVDDVFNDSVQGMLGRNPAANKLLAIGRGGQPSGFFYRSFNADAETWLNYRITAEDIPSLQGWCEEKRKEWGADSPQFRQYAMAEFIGAADGAIITADLVEKAVDRFNRRSELFPDSATWKRVLALDPAGGGSDESILTWRHGPLILKQKALSGDTMAIASATTVEAALFKADMIVIDAVGLGEGVHDRIREIVKTTSHRPRVVSFKAGERANNSDHYDNKKTEVVFRIRELLEQGTIAIADIPTLRSQLTSWSYIYTPKSKARVVDPDDSPDWADSAMLAFAADLYGGGLSTARMTLY